MERRNIFIVFIILSLLSSCQTIKIGEEMPRSNSIGAEVGTWRGKLKDGRTIKLSLSRSGNALLYLNNKLINPFKNDKTIVYVIDYNSKPIELMVVFMKEGETSEVVIFYIEFLSRDLLRVYTNFGNKRITDISEINNIFLLRR